MSVVLETIASIDRLGDRRLRADAIQADVDGDPIQPGRERRLPLEILAARATRARTRPARGRWRPRDCSRSDSRPGRPAADDARRSRRTLRLPARPASTSACSSAPRHPRLRQLVPPHPAADRVTRAACRQVSTREPTWRRSVVTAGGMLPPSPRFRPLNPAAVNPRRGDSCVHALPVLCSWN